LEKQSKNRLILTAGIISAIIMAGILASNYSRLSQTSLDTVANAAVAPDKETHIVDIAYNYVPLKKLAKDSGAIIKGTVLNTTDVVKYDNHQNPLPSTLATVRVDKVMKGFKDAQIAAGDIIEVQAIGNSMYIAPDGVDTKAGESAVFFVAQTDGDDIHNKGYVVYGEGMGKMKLKPDGKLESKFYGEMTEVELDSKINEP